MTKLYIGNVSRQDTHFYYRVPEIGNLAQRHIRAGSQEMVFEGSPEAVDAIIKQHEVYGILSVRDALKTKRYTGICYQIDKPLVIDDYKLVRLQNYDAKEAEGKETRERMALYGLATIGDITAQSGDTAKGMDIEIKQLGDDATYHEIFSPDPIDGASAAKRGRPKRS